MKYPSIVGKVVLTPLFATFLSLAISSTSTGAPLNKTTLKDIKSVVIIVLENTSYEDAIKQTYLKSLSEKGAFLTRYSAITHPSQPNYVAMISGGFEKAGDGDSPVSLDGQHIGDLLEARGKQWKVYAEGYPGNCFLGLTHANYARRHVPFLSFKNVQNNPSRCSRIVDATEFAKDVSSEALPEYSLYIPDVKNDGHDTGVAYADRYLAKTFDTYFENSKLLNHTLFIITFDEGFSQGNRVYTLFYGAGVKPGFQSSAHYNHYSLLLTIERLFGLSNLGKNDATASLIGDIWNGTL